MGLVRGKPPGGVLHNCRVETAGSYADKQVSRVVDDPRARLAFLRELYKVPASVDHGYLPFRRAASAFMMWQIRRGLLNSAADQAPGSPWWRAVNNSR